MLVCVCRGFVWDFVFWLCVVFDAAEGAVCVLCSLFGFGEREASGWNPCAAVMEWIAVHVGHTRMRRLFPSAAVWIPFPMC